MTIAIDFDGTCVTHEYPNIGHDIGAIPVLKALVNNGHKLILYTMRSGKTLTDALNWFKDNDISLYGINENPTQKNWTFSPKIFAHIYIDDANLGVPLSRITNRPFVDWRKIIIELADKGCLLPEEIGSLIGEVAKVQDELSLCFNEYSR